jgi:excinuclease ABC subunit C
MSGSKRDPASRRAAWAERVAELPTQPGVYVMKDAEGRVIYVGKAKNLRARVRSYFQEGTSDYRAFVGLLGGILADLDTVVTRSEKEALLLEREMIRRHEPRFNIVWRDDKQYLCLRIDPHEEYPWVQAVRHVKKDGARYFGPFHSSSAARQTLRVVNRHFQLRTCRDSVLKSRRRPCLEYQIGRCPAPCVYEIDRARYRESVGDVTLFLEGKGEELAVRLRDRMWGAAERTDYEVAAYYRDQLKAVEKTLEKQKVALPTLIDQDVFGLHREGDDLCIAVVEVRGGRAENISSHLFEGTSIDDASLLESFLVQRYALDRAGAEDETLALLPPEEVLVPVELESREALGELMSERRGQRVALRFPQRGDRASLLDLARENAVHGLTEQRRKSGAVERTLEGLKTKLRLARVPMRMECFDISNLGATSIVASQVVFERGEPSKKRYRRYKVKSTAGQDDFGAMYEVIARRLRRGVEEGDLPDLIVIDGGKGQLNAARAAFRDLGVTGVDLISLAKSRVVETDADDAPVRSPERVFVPGAKEPVVLSQTSAEVLLLARLRDEAHRFAITFHQKLRHQARMRSALKDVPGIGPTRERALLTHFGSLKRIRAASLEELAAAPGIGRRAAERLHAALHQGAALSGTDAAPAGAEAAERAAEAAVPEAEAQDSGKR